MSKTYQRILNAARARGDARTVYVAFWALNGHLWAQRAVARSLDTLAVY
jgi:hypothetical protein